jgi:hypothetical protein
MHFSRIVPASLYTDGVAYTKNDSFEGVSIRDLRSGDQELLSIVRLRLSSSQEGILRVYFRYIKFLNIQILRNDIELY